jgi:hypothetical protein
MMRPLVRCISLKAHLQQHVFDPLRRSATKSPVLVFSSQPADEQQQLSPLKRHYGRGVELAVATIASSVPTRRDVRKAQQLVDETRALTVLGVGSGAAMDLVKYLKLPPRLGAQQPDPQKVLIPGTSAAVMAAHTQHALILDEETQLLWTQRTDCASGNVSTVVQPGSVVASPFTAPACHTLLVDACFRTPECLSDVELARMALSSDPILEGPLKTSMHVVPARSAPLVLAAALLPTLFPQASLFSFWAALLPGMASIFDKTIHRDQFPHLEDLATNHQALSVETMMTNVQLHQQLTMGIDPVQDMKLEMLEQILGASLSRDS